MRNIGHETTKAAIIVTGVAAVGGNSGDQTNIVEFEIRPVVVAGSGSGSSEHSAATVVL